jgi:tetratricopeptide (TPR) repeat protein/uncharacterized membrane protein YgcG
MTNPMMGTIYRAVRSAIPIILASSLFFFAVSSAAAQSNSQLPSPTTYISDFARVVDAQTKERLESLLQDLKDKTKVGFYVATVDTTGDRDIFDFSRQLATDWNIGSRNSRTKSLLLVISVASKTSFTQFSHMVQVDLPDGILGEMSQRMRTPLGEERFAEAMDVAVHFFVSALAQKLGLAFGELDTSASTISPVNSDTTAETMAPPVVVSANERAKTRPRVVKQTSKRAEKEAALPDTPTAVAVQQTPSETPTQAGSNEIKQPEKEALIQPARTLIKPSKTTASPKTNVAPVDDEAEAEEVELTLTLPLPKRADKLKSFLETHPDSKARPRATELLISTYAGLGDQYLKNGDIDNGIRQLMLAIDQADITISDKLYSGVISQIPSNLYLRGQSDAAFQAAKNVETKFGSNPNRLLTIAGFYLGIERGDEAARIADSAVKLAPDMAEAHRVLALSRHINLQFDEAAAEYKRTIELDPRSRVSRSSLADLTRASGKTEEALALYNELLQSDPKDRAATAGMVICLLELGRKEEATTALDAALTSEPRNLALLSGVAYWFAAHQEYEKAVDFARKAIAIEPRYTWAQIALVRSLIGLKHPVGAERAMRFARQYGKFPTLNYELATVVAAMGFYDEAVEILRESFTVKDDQVETLLAGRIPARAAGFIELLAPERQASLYQPTAADSAANSKMLKDLLALDFVLNPSSESANVDETLAAKTARNFGSGNDPMRTYRQLYAASRLLKKTVALATALELVDEAKTGLETALDVSVVTTAVQADEFRNLRAQALASGNVPDIADAPRAALSNIMRGRIEDLTGWILFNQDKYPEAIEHLKQASAILPNGTPAWRNTLWHLGVAFEQTGHSDEALDNYIKSYNEGERDPIRRSVIERVYRKVNGSLAGLDERIGPAGLTSGTSTSPDNPATTEARPAATPETTTTTTSPAPQTPPEKPSPTPETSSTETATPQPTPTPTPTASESPTPVAPEPITDEALKAASSRLRSTIRISGRVLDSNNNGISNVVVVLISPSGSVLASTTDNDGKYSFNVMPSQKTYRVIPSKDGYTFSPLDKAFAGLIDDQKGIDFVGANRSP